jgi:hypothetical protein
MATVTSNFSSQSSLENLLTAAQNFESSSTYTTIENTSANLTYYLFEISPSSYTSTSATGYYGGMTAHYYGNNFGTASAVVNSADITDGTSTLVMTGSVYVGGQNYTGVINSLNFNGFGYS